MVYEFDPNIPIVEDDEYVSTWIKYGDHIIRLNVSKFALGELSGEATPQFADFKKVLRDKGKDIARLAGEKFQNGGVEDVKLDVGRDKFDIVILRSSDLGDLID